MTIAAGFSVTYGDTYKVLSNSLANESYVLTQCGLSSAPSTVTSSATGSVSIPLTSVAVPETVSYAFLELLGVSDRVESVSEYVTAPCGQLLALTCNKTAPDDFYSYTANETWLAAEFGAKADAILSSSVGVAAPIAISFSAASAPTILARSAWIKYVGALFNLDNHANAIFDLITENYDRYAAAVVEALDAVEAGAADDLESDERPTAAFTLYYDSSYQISFASYKVDVIATAGGKNLNQTEIMALEGVTASPYDTTTATFAWGTDDAGFATEDEAREAFLNVLKDVDVLIDETYAVDPTLYDADAFFQTYGLNLVNDSVLESLPFLEGNWSVYREDGLLSEALGLDWFEGAFARADLVLRDFVRAILGAEVAGTDEFTWIRTIHETPVVVGPKDCTSASGITSIDEACDAEPSTICPYVTDCGDGDLAILPANASITNTNSLVVNSCQYAACSA